MWYWLLKHILVGPVLRLLGRPKIEGLHHVPKNGPLIIAANHLAVVDSLYLCLVLRRRVTFIAKQEYFTEGGFRGRLNRFVMNATGQVPVDRTGGSAGSDSLAAAVRVLESGGIWGIHPEGTRSPDGRVYRGRTGVIRVAMQTGAPVIPVVLSGTDRVNPREGRFLRPAKVSISFGHPRYFLPADQQAVRRATDELMADIVSRSGRPYVDCYATTFKQRAA
ncbi:lysophospholipid acyltransferase family protein [Nocardia sp. NPDC059764]|uniref:lysophospholipid acyltransferase family protein n=1 Tax=Nocardia sp. NPDC059764 TaxID=3346939 RepID=UPI003665DEFD